MLRSYSYTFSKIQKAQSFVNHVMLDVVFNAKKLTAPTFDSTLVLPKYRGLIDNINADYIRTPLSAAYLICKNLGRKEIKLLRTAVHNNNKIRELCNGDLQPVKYKQIEAINANLADAIKAFCNSLYDHCLVLKPFYDQYEKIDAYYKHIVKRSKTCRCCGLGPILTQFHTHRGALDHYLPKGIYPFSSLNFRNLVPICEYCNGKYKLSEDTLYIVKDKGKKTESATRTVSFYPFSRTVHEVEIDIKFRKPYDSSIEPDDIDIELTCHANEEKVASWDRIFGIKENYKAECCTDEMRAYFEEQYIADKNFGQSHEEYIAKLKNNKYGDANFLRIPFLNAIRNL